MRETSVTKLLGIERPIIQAPMPCALLPPDALRGELAAVIAGTRRPFNVNFFCHTVPEPDPAAEDAWLSALRPYYDELGVDVGSVPAGPARTPFSQEAADGLGEVKPPIVSFHFATAAVLPLRAKAEAQGSGDFSPLWSGQHAGGCRAIPAADLTRELSEGVLRP